MVARTAIDFETALRILYSTWNVVTVAAAVMRRSKEAPRGTAVKNRVVEASAHTKRTMVLEFTRFFFTHDS